MEDVDISYEVVRFEGSLMHENIFRQTGSPKVDAAWESLGIECKSRTSTCKTMLLTTFVVDRHIVVPNDIAEKSGLRPDQVQISEKYGGGYPANVEGLHHLHCLVSFPMKIYMSLLT